jgi:phage-related protein
MAFNAGTVKATLDLKVQQFRKSVRFATKGFKSLGTAARAAAGRVKSFGGGFRGMAVKLAAAAAGFIAARAAIRAITGALKDGIAKQQEYEQSVRRLAGSLISQGSPALKKVTDELEAYATVLQDTTAFGDIDILNTAQSLVAFGAAEDKLKDYTKAVLDTASALNLDAKTAARAFGQALAGNAATLGRYIPALRGMTQEQLKAGAAFDKATEAFGGFSEIAATTTLGAVTQLGNAFDDLKKRFGAAFNEFLGPVAKQLTEVFRGLVNSMGEGTDGFKVLVEGMRTGFELVMGGVRLLIERFFEIQIRFKKVQLSAAIMQAAIVAAVTGITQVFTKLAEVLAGIIAGVVEFVAVMPGLSEGIKEAVLGVADFFRDVEKDAKDASAEMANMQRAAVEIVLERKKEVKVLETRLANIKAGVLGENALLDAVTKVYHIKVKESELEKQIRDQREQAAADAIRIQKLAAEQNERIQERLKLLREAALVRKQALESANATRDATQGIATAAGAAAGSAGRMADSFGRAASNASAAANSISRAASAGASASESRRSGGSFALDFSDPFRAVAQAQQAQRTLAGTHVSAFAGRTQVTAARRFADAVGAEAEAAVNRAIGDFTATILSELNAAGIFDPAQRSRIVRERITEAERLGVIPSASSLDVMEAGRLR